MDSYGKWAISRVLDGFAYAYRFDNYPFPTLGQHLNWGVWNIKKKRHIICQNMVVREVINIDEVN